MKKILLTWNINCDNDAKKNYEDEHEVRCETFLISKNKYIEIQECESCNYTHKETWINE